MLIVMKFGGTSVGTSERIARAADLAVAGAAEGHRVLVVTSAMGGVTNELIHAAEQASQGTWDPRLRERVFERHRAAAADLAGDGSEDYRAVLAALSQRLDRFEKLCFGLSMVHELTPRLLDAISGTGELLCAPLLAAAIARRGRPSEAIDATGLIVTTDQFGAAEPLVGETRAQSRARLLPLLDAGAIPVATGFIGATTDGVLTTLGRGGSDYSASILGAALDADEVWIWTDVDGVMTANPADVPEACTLPDISYSEASELAYYGARILHYKTILPASRQRIPVRILNSFNPAHPGTRVSANGNAAAAGVKAVTSIRDIALIAINGKGMQGIPGIAAKAFQVVAQQQANILMISQASSENNICFVINSSEAARVVRALRAALDVELMRGHVEEISAEHAIAIVAAIGDRMRGTPGIAARVFGALSAVDINVHAISQGSSEQNISLIVAEQDAAAAVRAIHRAFDLGRPAEAAPRPALASGVTARPGAAGRQAEPDREGGDDR